MTAAISETERSRRFRTFITVAVIADAVVLLLLGLGFWAERTAWLAILVFLGMGGCELVGLVTSILAVRAGSTWGRKCAGGFGILFSFAPWVVLAAFLLAMLLVKGVKAIG